MSGVLRAPDCIKKTPEFMRDLGQIYLKSAGALRAPEIVVGRGAEGGGGDGT